MLANVPTAPDKRAGCNVGAGGNEAVAVAGELGKSLRELDAEGRRFGMNAVAAPDGERVLVLVRARFESGEQAVDAGEQEIAGARELDVEAGVENVR